MHPGGGHLGGGNGHNVILEKALEKVLEKINQWKNSPNNNWSEEAEKWFRKKYKEEKKVEGPLNNELDAFRHAYGSALMSYYVGKFISGLIFDGHELGAANVPLEHRMDAWNNEVGRMIYDRIKSSLDPTKTKESLFLGQIADIPIPKDLDKVKEKIAEAVAQALDRGVLAKNLEDERLKKLFPDDPKLKEGQIGVDCQDLSKITEDARALLEKEKNKLDPNAGSSPDPDGTGEGGGGSDSGENGGGGNENANNGGEGSGNVTGQDGGNGNGVSDGDGSADGRGDGSPGGGFGGGDGAPTPRDPLLLDLNRNGKIDISRRAHFDFDKNGFKELSHWMSDGDGVLVMDRNGDGVVNDGTELFGDRTPLPDGTMARTGFEALAALDENGDGVVDASDGMFSSLKVWVDTNGDGISTSDELRSLEETGIKSIRLESAENGAVDEHGNVAARNGTFEWADGKTGAVGEMLLQGDAMHSVPTELLELSEELASMPELPGGGTLHDLRQAMARDESGRLKGLVESFAAAKDMESRRAILKELVFAWAGADSIEPGSRGGLVDARELAVLERYAGRDFVGSNGPNPHANAAPLLKQAYAGLMEHFYRNLVKQTHYDGYFRSMKESNTLGALEYLLGNMLSPEIGQEESVSRLRELVSLMKGGKISSRF